MKKILSFILVCLVLTFTLTVCVFADGSGGSGSFNIGKTILISLVIGVVAAFIVTSIMKGQLKTVRKQTRAENYVKHGSLNITEANTLYLYSSVTRVAKPKNNSSNSKR